MGTVQVTNNPYVLLTPFETSKNEVDKTVSLSYRISLTFAEKLSSTIKLVCVVVSTLGFFYLDARLKGIFEETKDRLQNGSKIVTVTISQYEYERSQKLAKLVKRNKKLNEILEQSASLSPKQKKKHSQIQDKIAELYSTIGLDENYLPFIRFTNEEKKLLSQQKQKEYKITLINEFGIKEQCFRYEFHLKLPIMERIYKIVFTIFLFIPALFISSFRKIAHEALSGKSIHIITSTDFMTEEYSSVT